jgi:hypothetical protein
MALPILDGNQTAATLSTIVTGGQHIPAHTVVSLGSQAITDMRSAVSGSVVSISNFPASQTISGTVTANAGNFAYEQDEDTTGAGDKGVLIGWRDNGSGEFRTVTDTQPLPISGTVTANNPSGALTTRFGSVTTANTAQLTSAVTKTSRKYLLVQNIAASTVTIGIGFAPTTTQGIQLTAGAGLTFDAFTPTGAIYWLSSVTGSNFSILEG